MSSYAVRSENDREMAVKRIRSAALPFTVTVKKGAPRSLEQNRLQRMWLKEAAEQGDQTAEEYRAYCKLHFGIPILRNENEEFKAAYDRVIRPLTYECKLIAMQAPLDFPITRLMTSKQKTTYLSEMCRHFCELGFVLTDPLNYY